MKPEELSLHEALELKAAEMWLEVGQPLQALRALRRLPEKAWRHRWTLRLLRATNRALSRPQSPKRPPKRSAPRPRPTALGAFVATT